MTRRDLAAAIAVAAVVLVSGGLAQPPSARAQTPTTTPTTAPATTVPPTTAPTTAPPTTAPPTTAPTTAAPTVPPTTVPVTSSTSSDDPPWLAIALAALGVVGLIAAVAAAARRRGERHSAIAAWRGRAADQTAEAGATARLVAGGTPVSAAIAQEVLTSLRAFDDLARTAPDEYTAAATHDAHQAVHALAVAIDADASARRAQPAVSHEQLDAAAAGLRSTAAEADRVLSASYHVFRNDA